MNWKLLSAQMCSWMGTNYESVYYAFLLIAPCKIDQRKQGTKNLSFIARDPLKTSTYTVTALKLS